MIQSRIMASEYYSSSQSVAFYYSTSDEVFTQGLFQETRRAGKKIAYPKVKGKQEALDFFWVQSLEQFQTSQWGIKEPDEKLGAQKATLEEIDLMLLPALAFDSQGYRLGRGEAFYDRTLKKFSGKRLGLAYSFQVLPEIPHEEWDEKVDIIATEKEWLTIR